MSTKAGKPIILFVLSLLIVIGGGASAWAIAEIEEPSAEVMESPAVTKPVPAPKTIKTPIWQADPVTGCKVWNPTPYPDDESFTWTGGCKDGYLEGTGVFQWVGNGKLGRKFEGLLVQGKINGKGSYIWPSGAHYEGDWIDNKRTGKGIFTWPNGDRYDGDLIDDVRNGKGVLTGTLKDGGSFRYEGDFVQNKSHGKGNISWGNGNRYEGDWVEGKRTGKGVYIWSNGNRYEGDFADGILTGYGIYRFADGRILQGRFQNGKYIGP